MDEQAQRQRTALPSIYDHRIGSASLLAAPHPFVIGTYAASTVVDELHWHDTYEIGYVLNGCGTFVVENQTYSFVPGQVHVINNSDRHMAFSESGAHFFNVHFHPDLLRDATFPEIESAAQRLFALGSQRFTPVLPADNPHTACVIQLLRRIAEEHQAGAPYWPIAVKGLLLQVIGLLLRYFLLADSLDEAQLRRHELLQRLLPALQLIEQRLDDPPSQEELAGVVALSSSRFSALFHEAIGMSPVAYRNSRRIVLAQRLMLGGNITIRQIAEQSGFNTVQQFNKIFHRMTGSTPSAYMHRLVEES